MNKNQWTYVLTVVLFLIAVPLFAQTPKYNASTEETLDGNAVYVAEHPSKASWTGVYAIMKDSRGGEIEVHLAPGAFLAEHGIEIATGNSLKVVGSRVPWRGCDIILARELTAKGTTLTLRNKSGEKLW